MARDPGPQAGQLFRVREGFAVTGPDGFMRTYATGALIDGADPIASSHTHLLEPASSAVEQMSAAPGERRSLGLRLPSGRSLRDATAHREGHAHQTGARVGRVPTNVDEGEADMPHALPPEHPDSPASTFAPDQPRRGVVADDYDDEQVPDGAVKAADATVADAEKGDGDVKGARAAAKVAKESAKADAQRAEDRDAAVKSS